MNGDTEIIICAAVRREDQIWRGHRHAHALEAMRDELTYHLNRKEILASRVEQGFMTSRNRFVDRKEGCQIQQAAGIPSVLPDDKGPYLNGELYSEDLY